MVFANIYPPVNDDESESIIGDCNAPIPLRKFMYDNPEVKVGGENYDRRTITEVDVKEGVTSFEDLGFTFMGCIKLPSTLTSIGKSSLSWCRSLESINFLLH